MGSPVYAFLDNPSMVDFSGHLAAVLFVSGCNFHCRFCHNAELLGTPRDGMPWERLAAACSAFRDNWVDGAVITGGEPTLADGLMELIHFCKKNYGWAVKLDTNGSRPAVLAECLPLVDYVAMDIKTGLSHYPDVTGYTQTSDILQSVALIKEEARDYEFRTTVIGPIHTDARMQEIGEIVSGARRYAIQPFLPKRGLPDSVLEAFERTPPTRLDQLRRLMAPFADEVIVRGERA